MRLSPDLRLTIGFLLTAACTGCATPRLDLGRRTGGSAALFAQFRAYDGRTGRPLNFTDVVRRCATADVIVFGEEHSDVVCNQLQAQLFHALLTQPRPVALAMEFFEADTQASLDAYLARRIDEPAFHRQTRQGRDYVVTHRPLIELARATHTPVIAANAPRRLVRAYRKSGLDYRDFRAGLPAEDQRWLPRRNTYLSGPYEDRFLELMSGHDADAPTPAPQPASAPASQPSEPAATAPADTPPPAAPADTHPAAEPAATHPGDPQPTTQPTESRPVAAPAESQPAIAPSPDPSNSPQRMYWAQLLWDEAMAESVALARRSRPYQRVLLIVGAFHVAHEGGTTEKIRARRPRDRIVTLVYRGRTDGGLGLEPEDVGAGDVLLYGVKPPVELAGSRGG